MEKIELKYKDVLKAIDTLDAIIREDYSIIVRDAAIQRFEYTFEALWKFLKAYLNEQSGIIENSPKGCFRTIFSLGFLTEEETVKFLQMTDRRNETSHTYKEEVAEIIFKEIPEYYRLMKNLAQKFEPVLTKQDKFLGI